MTGDKHGTERRPDVREPKHTPGTAEGEDTGRDSQEAKSTQQEGRRVADPGRTPGKAEG